MKKQALLMVGLMVFGSVCLAENTKFVVIDRNVLLQESPKGKKLSGELKEEFEALTAEYQSDQKDLVARVTALDKQSKVLSKEALAEKKEELEKKKQEYQFKISNKEESLRRKSQTKQHALFEEFEEIIKDLFVKNNWELLVDKNTPGVICKAENDKTEMVLKAINERSAAAKEDKATTKTAQAKPMTAPKAA